MTRAAQALVERAREAGLLGAASGEPVHPTLARSASVVVANAVSAEPLLRADAELLVHHADEVIRGLKLAMQATGARAGVVAVKRSDRQARAVLSQAIAQDGFAKFQVSVHVAAPEYPADESHHLAVAAAPGEEAVVLDVLTLYHLAEAHRGQSMTQRLVTLTGAVKAPRTVWVPIGTPFERLLEAAGGLSFDGPAAVWVGGPMRGRLGHPEGSVAADTASVAWLPEDHRLVVRERRPLRRVRRLAMDTCHQCRRCTELCPSAQTGALRPHKIMQAIALAPSGLPTFAAAAECIDCGLCTRYACPVDLDPARLIRMVREDQGLAVAPPPAAGDRPAVAVPLGRIMRRLGLTGLDHLAPLDPQPLRVKRIVLELERDGVARWTSAVREGDMVRFGQVVGRPHPEGVDVPLHSGLAGVVRSVGSAIVIEEIR